MPDRDYAQLIERVKDAHTLGTVGSVLHWDQEVMMPPAGAEFRAKQLGLMSTLTHRMNTDPAIGALLKKLARRNLAPIPAANRRLIQRGYDRATKLPAELVRELSETRSRAQHIWAEARQQSQFASFAPWLAKLVALKRRIIKLLPKQATPYDTLLDQYEEGMTCAKIDPLFGNLRNDLVPLVRARIGPLPQGLMRWSAPSPNPNTSPPCAGFTKPSPPTSNAPSPSTSFRNSASTWPPAASMSPSTPSAAVSVPATSA